MVFNEWTKTLNNTNVMLPFYIDFCKLRRDEVKSENIRDQILKNSPNENKDFFVVPKVVE